MYKSCSLRFNLTFFLAELHTNQKYDMFTVIYNITCSLLTRSIKISFHIVQFADSTRDVLSLCRG